MQHSFFGEILGQIIILQVKKEIIFNEGIKSSSKVMVQTGVIVSVHVIIEMQATEYN